MLGYISPTRYTAIRTCPLRVGFDLAAKKGGSQRQSAAAVPGIAAHRALEVLVATGGITEPDLPARVEAEWHRAVSEVVGTEGSPRELARLVPAYFLYAARLVNAAAHVAALVAGADRVEPEVLLASSDGVISGRADLVLTHGDQTCVADYKSRLRNPEENPRVRDEYASQLRLYAYMLHEARGVWPARAVLIPLDGRPVEVAVDPENCRLAAEDARAVLAAFESLPLDRQPARPSPGACRFCPHAAACEPFAAALSQEWAPELLACVGTVQAVETSARGGIAIKVAVESGSVAGPDVWLVRISSAIAEPLAMVVGTRIAAVGLAPAGQPGVFRLRELSVLSVRSA